jgi:voltage-gated potassium channel
LSILLVVYIYLQKDYFSKNLPFKIERRYLGALWMVIFVFLYGILGSTMLRRHYDPEIGSLIQALYYTVITVSTVGYGDYIPKTDVARLFTVSLVLLGLVCATTAAAIIAQPIIKRLQETHGILSSHILHPKNKKQTNSHEAKENDKLERKRS